MILATPGLCEFISGVIHYDETNRQSRKDGTTFVKVISDAGIIPWVFIVKNNNIAPHPHVASKEKVLEKWNVASNKNVLEERCFLLPYF
ncbi:MAG: fructose-bisphosphate aldolase [Synergistaceae bacterium]|nr:fructose-bisphosphate aldolase [Synergistaceae bacterium]